MKKLPLSLVLVVLEVAFIVARGLAQAMASDSDGGKKITQAELKTLLELVKSTLFAGGHIQVSG